jgi:hypothetical protein
MEAAFRAMGIGTDCQSRHGKQNHWYTVEALNVLKDDPLCAWLGCDDYGALAAGTKRLRSHTIMAALGRYRHDPDYMRELAHLICEIQPRVSDAVRMIRWRSGRGKEREPSLADIRSMLADVRTAVDAKQVMDLAKTAEHEAHALKIDAMRLLGGLLKTATGAPPEAPVARGAATPSSEARGAVLASTGARGGHCGGEDGSRRIKCNSQDHSVAPQ